MEDPSFDLIFNKIKQVLRSKKQKEVAIALGISAAAISDAKSRGVIPENWIDTIEERYGIDRSVFLGLGETGEQEADYSTKTHEGPSVVISEMLFKTSKVLESKTVYRSALASNINAFYEAVQGEEEMSKLSDGVAGLRSAVEQLTNDLATAGITATRKKEPNAHNGA